MLERMRAHAQSWIAKALLGGIILSFALWGVADYFLSPKLEPVAEVDGKPIPPRAFAMAYERQLARMRAQLGGRFTRADAARLGLPRATLEALVDERIVLDEAKELGLVVPDAILAATVQAAPDFQVNGRFDPARYQAVVRALGYAHPRDYEKALRAQILAAHLRAALARSAIVGEDEARARFFAERERRRFEALFVPVDAVAVPAPTDADLRQWFEAHRERYRTPEKLVVAYVALDPAELAKEMRPSEEEIRKAYEERKARYTEPEARRLRHWWMPAKTDAGRKKARALAARIVARVRKGADFAKAAREVSGRKAEDLGWMKRGELADRLEKIAFALRKGEVSDPVVTDRGVHLFWLADVRPARVRPLAEVRDAIARELALARAREEVAARADELDDALGRADTLEEAASDLGLPVRTATLPRDALARDPVLGAPEVRKALEGLAPGDPVPLVETDDGRVVAVEVKKRIAAQPMDFAAAKEQVRRDWIAAKREELARARAERLLARLREGAAAARLAAKAGAQRRTIGPVARDEAASGGLPAAAVEAAFTAARGAWLDAPYRVPGGFLLLRVAAVERPDEKEWRKAKARAMARVAQEKGAVRVARWMASLRKRHEVVIHEDALEKALR